MAATNINRPSDPGPDLDLSGDQSRRLAAYWKDQIDDVNEAQRRWQKRGRTIEKRYRDERNRVDEEGQRRFASLWSNVEILFPALYARVPLPVVERRFRDRDPSGRGAAQILERGLRNEIEICGYSYAVDCAVLDYLLPGRGTVWIRYEPEFGEGVSIPSDVEMDMRDARGNLDEEHELTEDEHEREEEEKLSVTGERIIRESTPVDYVQWTDFFTFPAKARTWNEVTAVGKRVFMTRNQMIRRFGEKIGKAIPLERDDRERRRQNETVFPEDESDERGQVYEIWNRNDEMVYWVAEGYERLCDRVSDPLGLDGFFPCPRPLYANRTNNSLVPVPDYMQYQDQAIEIDELTQRVSMLVKACKVAGCYNGANQGLKRLLDESVENELIPVDNWAMFAEKGGIAGSISFLPLKEIIEAIDKLSEAKGGKMAEMDRLTGITDIMRGTTDARETMGAQRLKTNSSSIRIKRRQAEVARFCRDIVRLMADIMCRHFSTQSMLEASGALYEEGLGPDVLSDAMGSMQTGIGMGPQPMAPVPPMATPGGIIPSLSAAPPAVPPGPSAGTAGPMSMPSSMPAPMPGGNVVPFPQGGGIPPPMPMGAPPPPPGPPPAMLQALARIAAAMRLLRDERLRGFRVDIEVDSTVYGDEQADKADRTEFIKSVTMFLGQAMQMGAAMPEAVPLLGKLLQFGVRGFKVGRDLETAIEDFCEEAEEAAKKRMAGGGAQQQPDPRQLKAQADAAKAGHDMQVAQMKIAGDQQKAAAEVERQRLENEGEAANSRADLMGKQADLEMRRMELEIERLRMEIKSRELAVRQAEIWANAQGTALPGITAGVGA